MKFILFLFPCIILAAEKPITAGNPSTEARKVSYRNGDSVPVFSQYGWETITVLPSSEATMDMYCGNATDWTVHVQPKTNFVAITPNKPGVRKTNVVVIAASGNLYTLELTDVSYDANGHADTQVILNVTDETMQAAINGKPKYMLSEDADAFREQADRAKTEYEQKLQAETEKLQAQVGAKVHTNYRYNQSDASKEPFKIESLWHDDRFTFFRASSQEALSVYEIKDGKPVAINMFPSTDGTVRLDRVVEQGYFRIGKKQLGFSLQGE